MKTTFAIAASLVLLLSAASFHTRAQQSNEPAVKILPTTDKGIVKVLYAYDNDQEVSIRFFNEVGTLCFDKVKANAFENGFTKKYDISKVFPQDFWIEVSSPAMSATYKMIKRRGQKAYEPVLEKTSYNHPTIASVK
jgi:hypothetical protein